MNQHIGLETRAGEKSHSVATESWHVESVLLHEGATAVSSSGTTLSSMPRLRMIHVMFSLHGSRRSQSSVATRDDGPQASRHGRRPATPHDKTRDGTTRHDTVRNDTAPRYPARARAHSGPLVPGGAGRRPYGRRKAIGGDGRRRRGVTRRKRRPPRCPHRTPSPSRRQHRTPPRPRRRPARLPRMQQRRPCTARRCSACSPRSAAAPP